MLGAAKARCASVNVNYRYVAEELRYVLADSRAAGDRLPRRASRPRWPRSLADLPDLRLLLQVDDGSRRALLPDGALDYEAALAGGHARGRPRACPPTTSTSSTPAARPACPRACCGARPTSWPPASASRPPPTQLVAAAARSTLRVARRTAVHARRRPLERHQRVVRRRHRRDPGRSQPARPRRHPRAPSPASGATSLLIVGDAFARPLVDALRDGPPRRRPAPAPAHRRRHPLGVGEGGAPRAGARPPDRRRARLVGDRPAGRPARPTRPAARSTGTFAALPHRASCCPRTSPGCSTPATPSSAGWPRRAGCPSATWATPTRRPRTFPVGRRRALRGGRRPGPACWPTARVELHGRDSVTINTGGEKVFAEEVEQALKRHPAVFDAVVVGRPSERWGQEVVAVVQLRAERRPPSDDELRAAAAPTSPATSCPKAFVRVPAIERSPSGKPDYRWARRGGGLGGTRARRSVRLPMRRTVPLPFAVDLASIARGPLRVGRARPHDPPGRARPCCGPPARPPGPPRSAPSTTATASRPRRGATGAEWALDQAPGLFGLPRRPRRLRPGRPGWSAACTATTTASASPAPDRVARGAVPAVLGQRVTGLRGPPLVPPARRALGRAGPRPRRPAAAPARRRRSPSSATTTSTSSAWRRSGPTRSSGSAPTPPASRRPAPGPSASSASGSRRSPASALWTSAEVARAGARRRRRGQRRRLPPQAPRQPGPSPASRGAPTTACSSCSSPTPATAGGCASSSRSAGAKAPRRGPRQPHPAPRQPLARGRRFSRP